MRPYASEPVVLRLALLESLREQLTRAEEELAPIAARVEALRAAVTT